MLRQNCKNNNITIGYNITNITHNYGKKYLQNQQIFTITCKSKL